MIVAILLPDFILYRGLFMDCSKREVGMVSPVGSASPALTRLSPEAPHPPADLRCPTLFSPQKIPRNVSGNNLGITMGTPPGTIWGLPLGTIPAAS